MVCKAEDDVNVGCSCELPVAKIRRPWRAKPLRASATTLKFRVPSKPLAEPQQARELENFNFNLSGSDPIVAAGMHGIEQCIQERWTLRLSAPRLPVFPATASMLPGAPQALPKRDLSLATAFRSPITNPAFTEPIPGSTFPACCFASLPTASAVRSALELSCPHPVCIRIGQLHRSEPVTASTASYIRSASSLRSPSGQ
jgi:hypothetical protein